MKAKCVEVGESKFLKLGGIYEVVDDVKQYLLIKDKDDGEVLCLKKYFEPVKEEGFNAQNTTINIAGINFSCKDTPFMFATKNWNVKEDKMEEVRVVRNLKDLDGLENGMGLVMAFDTEKVVADIEIKTLSILRVFNSEILYKVDVEIKSSLEFILEIAKSMGFKFEHKPLRTVKEVLEEIDNIKGLKYDNEKSNWCIVFSEDSGFYSCGADYKISRLGTKYMSEEQAQKYCNELNEILKNN